MPDSPVVEIREEIQSLLNAGGLVEVTPETQQIGGGVYLLYVDDFSDDRVIPMYVGRTEDLHRRYRDHLKEIMSLNRLEKAYYQHILLRGFYDGSLRACKIFKYMVEHDCSLNQLRMVVLEHSEDPEDRSRIERNAIDKFRCPFLGFNQLNVLTESFQMGGEPTESEYHVRLDTLGEDVSQVSRFMGLGFTDFNYRRSCPHDVKLPTQLSDSEALQIRAEEVNLELEQLHRQFLSDEERQEWADADRRRQRQDELTARVALLKEKAAEEERDLVQKLHARFTTDGIRSKDATENFAKSILLGDERARLRFERYCEKRALPTDYHAVFAVEAQRMSSLRRGLDEAREESHGLHDRHWEAWRQAQTRLLAMLLPQPEYGRLPLRDRYSPYVFEPECIDAPDSCRMRIAISNNGRPGDPEIIKIDYQITSASGERFQEGDLFIRCDATRSPVVSYQERDYLDLEPVFFPQRFAIRRSYYQQPCRFDADRFWDDGFVSVGAELRTGINDFTISQFPLNELSDIVMRIDGHTTPKTRFRFDVTESKSCLKRAISGLEEDLPNTLVVRKLVKHCRSKQPRDSWV